MAKKITRLVSILVANELRTGATKDNPQGIVLEGAKAWINFNGTGTIAIRVSFNVSGLVDNGTGHYTVSWDIDFADTKYSYTYGAENNVLNPATEGGGQLVGSLHMRVREILNGGIVDAAAVCVQAFGAQ